MIFDDQQSDNILSSQLGWFVEWMARLPPTTPHIRMVMDCTRVIDQDILEEWVEDRFLWEVLARELGYREVEVLEVEVVHDYFTWEDILEGSSAEAYLHDELKGARPTSLQIHQG